MRRRLRSIGSEDSSFRKNKALKNKEVEAKRRKPIWGYVIVGLIYLLAVTLLVVCKWSKKEFGVNIDKIVFTIFSPMKGSDMSVVEQGVKACLPDIIKNFIPYVVLVMFDCWLDVSISIKGKIRNRAYRLDVVRLVRTMAVMVVFCFLGRSVVYAEESYEIVDYVKAYNDATTIFEDYYVDPADVTIKAADKKKNLIYIYLESMETTYASKEAG